MYSSLYVLEFFIFIMTITKDNYKSIDCIDYSDEIEFTDDLKYGVESRYLYNLDGSNPEIFDVLYVDKNDFL